MGNIGIAVAKEYLDQGIATKRGVRLYEKLGFVVEGLRSHEVVIDDCYYSTLLTGLRLYKEQ